MVKLPRVSLAQPENRTNLDSATSRPARHIDGSPNQEPTSLNRRDDHSGPSTIAKNTNPPRTDSAKAFRLMALPAELRLMIAEFVICHDRDLIWRWKDDKFTSRTGCFVTKSSLLEGELDHGYLTRLWVSRQLRLETLDLWKKFAVLHFDGVPNAPSSQLILHQGWHATYGLDRAVMAYAFFVTHPRTNEMDRAPSVVIHAAGFMCFAYTKNQLHDLGRDKRLSDIRIVAFTTHERDTRKAAQDPMTYLTNFRNAVEKVCNSETKPRYYNVFPDPEVEKYVKDLPAGSLSVKEFGETMDLIHNGI